MTNNNIGNTGSFTNVVYDTGMKTTSGRNRVGISAPEIELFDDIPPSSGKLITTSLNNASYQMRPFDPRITSSSFVNNPKPQNNYQTLNFHREQPYSSSAYSNEDHQQLNSTVDKLLEKYAPEALPQNMTNTTSNYRQPPQPNVVTERDQPLASTFQPTVPSTIPTSNNYSTIMRPTNGQALQRNTITDDTMVNNNNINKENQLVKRPRPVTTYDSFQHASQTRQPELKSLKSIPVQIKDGDFAQVVPGKLYTLTDDPLHLLYERQYPSQPLSASLSQSQPSIQSTFQPSKNFKTPQDHFDSEIRNASNTNPTRSTSIRTDNNSNGMQPFDLGNLIRNVQQDYLREIQPFVSSVKFVQKDHELGQSLRDIDFVTPVTVRQGFTGQANDILRRSFGRKKEKPTSFSQQYSNEYYDAEDKNNPHSSMSPYSSDDEDEIIREPKKDVHDQGTSPPPQSKQPRMQLQMKNPPATSKINSTKPTIIDAYTSNYPMPTTLAKRVSPDRNLTTSSEEELSDHEGNYAIQNNKREQPSSFSHSQGGVISSLVTGVPIQTSHELINSREPILSSEDINPIPPTVRNSQPNSATPGNFQNPLTQNISDRSISVSLGSNQASDSDYENKLPSNSTAVSNVQRDPIGIPGGRDVPQPTGRDAPQSMGRDAPPPTGRDATQPTGRDAPQTATRGAVQPTGRDAAQPTGRDAPQPTGRDAPQPTGRDAAQPTGRDAPQPTGRDAPQPTGRDAPQPTGRDATQPTGRDAPQPTGRDAPQPTGRDAPQPTGRDAPQTATRGAPQPTGRDAPQPTGRDAPQPTGRDAPQTATRGAPQPTGRDAPQPTGRDAPQTATRGAPQPTGRDAPQPTGRDAPQPTGRDAPQTATRGAPQPTGRDAPQPTGRDAPQTATRGAPQPTGRDAPQPAGRDAPQPAGRDAPQANARVTTASSAAGASSGSTRLFKSENDSKSTIKRSFKDMPAAIGSKFRSVFRRKDSS